MPNSPNLLDIIREFITSITAWWPQVYAWFTAFLIGLLRSLLNGSPFVRSLLEALLCGCLTLAVVPVLDYYGLSLYLAVAIGGAIAFLGVDWFRTFLANNINRFTGRRDK